MARQGLNCTLSYLQGKTRHTFQVRCSALAHGLTVLFDESQARVRKTFYPHQLSSAQFVLVVDLVGEDEYTTFMAWLATYAKAVLDTSAPVGQFSAMAVSLTSPSFVRKGVMISGYEWGDAVGKASWKVTLLFETSEEPIDARSHLDLSSVSLSNKDPQQAYFFPSATQLNGNQAPPDQFSLEVVTADTILGLVNGANSAVSSAISAVSQIARGG